MTGTTDRGLRTEKKQKTRDALVRAAYDHFLHQGYDTTTVDEIARSAGVSRRTFFRYFRSKEDVLFFRHTELLELFRDAIHAAPPEASSLDAVRRGFAALAVDYTERRAEVVQRYRIVQGSVDLMGREGILDRRWEETITEMLLDRHPSDPDRTKRARLFAAAVMGMARVVVDGWVEEDGRTDLVRMAQESFDLLADSALARPFTGREAPAAR